LLRLSLLVYFQVVFSLGPFHVLHKIYYMNSGLKSVKVYLSLVWKLLATKGKVVFVAKFHFSTELCFQSKLCTFDTFAHFITKESCIS